MSMRTECFSNGRNHADNAGEDRRVADQLEGNVKLGDIIWVRPDGCSWWPAQVFDENAVSGNSKPHRTSADEVLVRLYGSYEYLYVDPMICRSDFDTILKQHNGNRKEIFQKSLDQEITRSKAGSLDGQGSRSREMVVWASKDEKLKQNKVRENKKIGASNSLSLDLIKTPKAHPAMKNATANSFAARVSPARKLAAHSQQAKMSNGNASMDIAEDKHMRNPKKDGLQKKLAQRDQSWNRKTRSSFEKNQGAQSLKRRTRSSCKKNEMQNEEELKLKGLGGDKGMKGNTSKKVGSLKKLKELKVRDLVGDQEMKSKTSKKVGLSEKPKENRRNRGEDWRGKIPKQNGLIKKRKEVVENKSPDQGRGSKKLKLSSRGVEVEEGSRALAKKPEPDGLCNGKTNQKTFEKGGKKNTLKRNGLSSKQDSACQKLEDATALGKTLESNSRRTKVMQSLGLVAPSGSLFV